MVVHEEIVSLLLSKLFERVGPEDVAHQAVCGWFAEAVNLRRLAIFCHRARLTYAFQVVKSVELRAQTTVYTQELLVHDCGQGQRAERVHACFVYGLGVLVFALELEGEVVGQMAALVVSSKKPERVGVPDLQRPQVEYALSLSAHACDSFRELPTSMLK